MDSHIQDKIESHLLGRMTEEEKKAFEAEMEADEELKKQYLLAKALKQEANGHARQEEKPGQGNAGSEKERPVSSSSKRKWMYAAVLMSVAVLVAFLYLHMETTDVSDPPIRSGESSAFNKEVDSLVGNKEYAKALENVEGKVTNCEGLIEHYKNFVDSIPAEYAGEAEAPSSPEEARKELKKAEAELMDLKLIKAQVLLKKGEKDKAAAILKELSHEDSTVQETAKELLEEID